MYTVLQFPAPKKGIAYKMVPKGTDRAGIIRCAVILAHSIFYYAYNSILKGTRCAMNCLKMHFVSIFTTPAEVFIRCAVILPAQIFILRTIPFLKERKLQRTAKKSSSFPFLRHLQKKYIRSPAISLT